MTQSTISARNKFVQAIFAGYSGLLFHLARVEDLGAHQWNLQLKAFPRQTYVCTCTLPAGNAFFGKCKLLKHGFLVTPDCSSRRRYLLFCDSHNQTSHLTISSSLSSSSSNFIRLRSTGSHGSEKVTACTPTEFTYLALPSTAPRIFSSSLFPKKSYGIFKCPLKKRLGSQQYFSSLFCETPIQLNLLCKVAEVITSASACISSLVRLYYTVKLYKHELY